jgi:hypothetical protein
MALDVKHLWHRKDLASHYSTSVGSGHASQSWTDPQPTPTVKKPHPGKDMKYLRHLLDLIFHLQW